jgi:hypothetical protein
MAADSVFASCFLDGYGCSPGFRDSTSSVLFATFAAALAPLYC